MSLDDTPNEFGIGLMTLASEAGFEPTNAGVKIPCLTTWLLGNNWRPRVGLNYRLLREREMS